MSGLFLEGQGVACRAGQEGRLLALHPGVVARAEGDRVTLTVQANATEAGRVLRISSALQELGAAE